MPILAPKIQEPADGRDGQRRVLQPEIGLVATASSTSTATVSTASTTAIASAVVIAADRRTFGTEVTEISGGGVSEVILERHLDPIDIGLGGHSGSAATAAPTSTAGRRT